MLDARDFEHTDDPAPRRVERRRDTRPLPEWMRRAQERRLPAKEYAR